MADDLVISLSADTRDFLRDMQNAAGQVKRIGSAAQETNSLLSRMNWGMMAGGLATGLQDAASVLSNNGTFRMALNAAGNNLIQVAAMAHPIAGALAAAGIAAVQLAPLLSMGADQAKRLREEAEAGAKALVSAIGAMSQTPDKTKADVQKEIDTEEEKSRKIRNLRNANTQEIFRIENQRSALNTVKTLNANEQRRVDMLKAENKEYAEQLKLGVARVNQLSQQQQLADEASGRTTEEIERMEADAEAIWASVKREEQRALEEMGLRKSREEEEADKIHAKAKQDAERWKAELDAKHREDALAVRNSIMNPQEVFNREAMRLSHLPLTDEERTKALMRQASSLFGGPQLSASLVKGSIEEESFRNRREAENRNQQFIRQMVDKIVRELKPKEPPPAEVVGGGH